MARNLAISCQNQTFTVMKTSTLILSLSLLVLVNTTEAISQPSFSFYYSNYGDQLAWNVPQPVMYKIHRSFYGYDVVHVRQVPYRDFIDFEVILENRGAFFSVNIDHYGRILNSVQLVNTHFAHHICDSYCGFHANHYRRFYSPRPVVIVNKYDHHHQHGNGYAYSKNYNYGNKGKGNSHGKAYGHSHSQNNGHKYRDSQQDHRQQGNNGQQYGSRRDNNSGHGSDNKYRVQTDDRNNNSKSESETYRRDVKTVRPATTSTARQMSTRAVAVRKN